MTYMEEFNSIVREHFDISDTPTRKCIIALEDVEQSQLIAALSSALYDKIVEKVDKIDFGTIPRSRGDITKVDGFDNTVECLNIMKQLVAEYNENTAIVDSIITAIGNIKDRKAIFMKAYALNVELPMVLYNLITMCIEQSVSFLISVCIQYIKDPASEDISAALDKVAYNNSKDNLLFEQITNFNSSCVSGDLDRFLNNVMKNIGKKIAESCDTTDYSGQIASSPFQKLDDDNATSQNNEPEVHQPEMIISQDNQPIQEIGVLTAGGILGALSTVAGIGAASLFTFGFVIKVLIPMLRNITYYCYYSKIKLADCLATQAQLIEANAYKLQYSNNSKDEKSKEKTIEKQLKLAEKMKKWSEKFTIDSKKSKKQALELANNEKKKMKIEDMKDEIPSDIFAKSVLF